MSERRTLILQNTTLLQIGLTWSVTLKRTTRYDGVKYGFLAPRSCGNQLLGLQNDQQLQIVPGLSCIVLALAENWKCQLRYSAAHGNFQHVISTVGHSSIPSSSTAGEKTFLPFGIRRMRRIKDTKGLGIWDILLRWFQRTQMGLQIQVWQRTRSCLTAP